MCSAQLGLINNWLCLYVCVHVCHVHGVSVHVEVKGQHQVAPRRISLRQGLLLNMEVTNLASKLQEATCPATFQG